MRTLSAASIVALLISAVAGILLVNSAKANFIPPERVTTPPQIYVLSPETGKTYGNSIVFRFDGQKSAYTFVTIPSLYYSVGYYSFSQVRYWLDGVMLGQLNDLPEPFSVTLTELSLGQHNVEVTATANWASASRTLWTQFPSVSSGKVYFTVETTPPSMPILSPQNKTYDTSDVPLNFTISEAVSWIGYALDSKANVTIAECVCNITDSYGEFNIVKFVANTVLTGLSEGSHSLTIYAEDAVGNAGVSETVYFTVAKKTEAEPQPSGSFPIEWVAVAAISVFGAFGAALIIFLRRQNHHNKVQEANMR